MLNIGPSYEKPPESTPPHDRHENHKVIESFYSENRPFEHQFFFGILEVSLWKPYVNGTFIMLSSDMSYVNGTFPMLSFEA